MNRIKTVCVYCGSGSGSNPRFVEAAIALGKAFAENSIRLVYCVGSVGLMGAVAKSVLDHGASVTGIIPDFLRARENSLTRVQEMIVTPDMHERKRLMFERSDAFVALPGGVGTLEELVEQLTWKQLGRHGKPVLLANIDGFWEPLLALVAHMRAAEFIRPSLPVDILKAERVEEILPRLRAKTDVDAAGCRNLGHIGAKINPELRIVLAEADRCRARDQSRKPERRQCPLIKPHGTLEITDADGDMIDHGPPVAFCARSRFAKTSRRRAGFNQLVDHRIHQRLKRGVDDIGGHADRGPSLALLVFALYQHPRHGFGSAIEDADAIIDQLQSF